MRARKFRIWLLFVLLFVPLMLTAHNPADSDDFTAYVEQIREWGMTENARASILMIASIEAGTKSCGH